MSKDLVEVVRCKDCKYCVVVDEHEYWCNGFCSPARLVTPIDFCSHGVNKSELCCAFNGTAEEYLELCKKAAVRAKVLAAENTKTDTLFFTTEDGD